jgi:agmatine/peptidylarginine deiminase
VSESEAKQFESQYFGDATRSPYLHADLVAFLQKTHNVFSSHGFQVVAIPAPRPKVAYAKIIYRHEPSQAVVRTELVRDYVHRSYTNSLIANGYVFMPSYESAKTVTELVAEKTYRDLGFIVRTVNMSESIKAGGAVHCLSMGLH